MTPRTARLSRVRARLSLSDGLVRRIAVSEDKYEIGGYADCAVSAPHPRGRKATRRGILAVLDAVGIRPRWLRLDSAVTHGGRHTVGASRTDKEDNVREAREILWRAGFWPH
jgi:hypothetical protein